MAAGDENETRASRRAARAAAEPAGNAPKPRPRVSVVGVIGELLLTFGVIALLFVTWQMWLSGLIGSSANYAAARDLEQQWEAAPSASAPAATTAPSLDPSTPAPDDAAIVQDPATADPIVRPEAARREIFGIMYVPRFDPNYAVSIAGGVSGGASMAPAGIGHYPGTQMPGEIGNAAFAAHRTGYDGWPFYRIADLRPGDAIIIGTQDGWYTYRFRNFEYVKPSGVGVLDTVPQGVTAEAGARYITLTSCSPVHTTLERIIAYGSFESFTPRSSGPPTEIADVVARNGA